MPKEIFLILLVAALIAYAYVAYKIGRSRGKEDARKAAIFEPGGGYWQELATLVVWKCAHGGVHITEKDMSRYEKEFRDQGGAILYTDGEPNRLIFKVLSRAQVQTMQAPTKDKNNAK